MALPKLAPKQHTACPYCFVELNFKHVAYRCSGIPASGRTECVPYRDPVRAEALGDSSAVLPPVLARAATGQHIIDDRGLPELATGKFGSPAVCDRCGGRTAVAICPSCHSILPEEINTGAVSIGVVGARNSGKTVLLTLMDQELRSRMQERFLASIDPAGGTVGLANELVSFRDQMQSNRALPQQTRSTGRTKKAPAVYRWKWVDGPAKIISIYDTAGEDVANRDNAMVQHHLTTASAIILVIDPFSLGENRAKAHAKNVRLDPEHVQNDVLDGLTTVLRQAQQARGGRGGNAKITTPLAVVVTKMDAFWDDLDEFSPLRNQGEPTPYFDDEESKTVHEHLKSLVRSWGGHSIVNKLESEFTEFRMFGVSALGTEPDYGGGSLAKAPSPSRVSDPLLWVLHREGFLQKTAAPKGR